MVRKTTKNVCDALSWPLNSRTTLSKQLLYSRDDLQQKEFDRLWADEVEDCIDAYERGELKTIPWREVLKHLKS